MQLINIMQLKSTSNMESKLLFIFENVNGWLKYIEAKNVALLTLSSALIVCLLQILKSNEFHKQVIFFFSGILSSGIHYFRHKNSMGFRSQVKATTNK